MKTCPHCREPLLPGEDLVEINNDLHGIHRECLVRAVAGSVGHQKQQCECYGVEDASERGMTPREAARAALAYVRENLATLEKTYDRHAPRLCTLRVYLEQEQAAKDQAATDAP